MSDECDELTGQCNCKKGVTGRRCEKCELPRHLLSEYKCQRKCLRSCCWRETVLYILEWLKDKISSSFTLVCDNCTQTLLDTVDEIIYTFEVNMQDINLHNLNAPWLKLSNETDFLNSKFDEYFAAVDAVDNFNDIASDDVSSEI